MRRGPWVAITLLAVVLAAPRDDARGRAVPNELVVNPGADSGTTDGWISSGYSARGYQEAGDPSGGPYPQEQRRFLFSDAGGSGSLVQDVSVASLAEKIDSHEQSFQLFGYLGGTEDRSASAQVVYDQYAADGRWLGTLGVLGPPSVGDRDARTGMVECRNYVPALAGTRTIRVTVHTVGGAGTALADEIRLADGPYGELGVYTWPADGRGCRRSSAPQPTPTPTDPAPSATASVTPTASPTPTATPTRAPRPVVSGVRLSRRQLRFRVSVKSTVDVWIERRRQRGGWRAVQTFAVTGEGDVARRLRRLSDGRYRLTLAPAGGRRVVSYRRLG